MFERKHYDGDTFRDIAEWSATQPWGPISLGCVVAWYRRACEWWDHDVRLTQDQEYAGLRHGLDLVASEVIREYRAGRLDVKTFAELTLKVGAEIRTLTGAGRQDLALPVGPVQVPIAAQAAIDDMRARREAELAQRRKVIGP